MLPSSLMTKLIKFLIILPFIVTIDFHISFAQEVKKKCRINSNKQVLDFVKKELTPFRQGTNEEGPRLSNADIKQLEIKHYSEQLKD